MTARSLALFAILLRSCLQPAFACPVVEPDAGNVQVVSIGAGCAAPFDGVLHSTADDASREQAAARAADALDASADKIRKMKAAADAVEDPPSRLRWLSAGAAAVLAAWAYTAWR